MAGKPVPGVALVDAMTSGECRLLSTHSPGPGRLLCGRIAKLMTAGAFNPQEQRRCIHVARPCKPGWFWTRRSDAGGLHVWIAASSLCM
eukprot:scaffold118773_cov28-Tisochrysis_lutea.AAC.3